MFTNKSGSSPPSSLLSSIVITGASSGLGKALAMHYARPGLHLAISGRDRQRLSEVQKACEKKGAIVSAKIIDVTDSKAMHDWLLAIDKKTPIDLLIANAGISAGMGGKTFEKPDQIRKIFDVNLNGVLNTIDPVLPAMVSRKRGNIAIMSSLAGFRGFPGAPAYAGSKAAVRIYGESLGGSLAGSGVKIHVICPGFVATNMTRVNDFPMPFLMSSDRAAKIIENGIRNNKSRISFPWQSTLAVWFLSCLPDCIASYIIRKTPSKTHFCE